jgi:hypothetical protein
MWYRSSITTNASQSESDGQATTEMKVAGPRKRMKSLLVMLAGAHSKLD